jgi:hypothetical protein
MLHRNNDGRGPRRRELRDRFDVQRLDDSVQRRIVPLG